MGNYYDYTDEFNDLITNTKTIIDNQEEIKTKLDNENSTSNMISFVLILMYVLSIIRKVFKK